MPDTPSITIVQRFTYRGLPEETANTFHFSGTQPADDNAWKTLADALIDQIKTCVVPDHTFVEAYGYNAGNNTHVFAHDYTLDAAAPTDAGPWRRGTLALTSASEVYPGDTAVWIRWDTGQKNSKGRPIFLRNYFHGQGGRGDTIDANAVTALTALGAKLTDGSLPGGFKKCGPQGAVAGTPRVAPFAGFRQLKRTGKRPT